MRVSKTSAHIKIKIKVPNPSQEPQASSKAPNEDLKHMDVLCTLKIKIESQNSEYVCTKDQWPYPNQDFKDIVFLCTFKINIESLNLDHCFTKDQWPYPNQDHDAKTQSGTSSVLKSTKSGLKWSTNEKWSTLSYESLEVG